MYNVLGEQISRTVTSEGGDMTQAESWSYNPDGTMAGESDQGVPTGLYSELVDNSDIGDTAKTGTWTTSASGSGFEGPDYATHAPGAGSGTFTWKLNVPQDGTYAVYVKYPAVSVAATNASYTVSYSGGTATTTVDQSQNAGQWVKLGSWSFTQAAANEQIALSENISGTVTADAVKIVRDDSGDTNASTHSFGYFYDASGNLTSITDSSPAALIARYGITYDQVNQVTAVSEDNSSGSAVHSTSYGYDAAGNLTSMAHDGAPSSYGYNALNQLVKETDATSSADTNPQVTSWTYTPAGQWAGETKPNGNTTSYAYFEDGLPSSQVENTSSGTLVDSHDYSYNPNGDMTQNIEKVMSADDSGYLSHTLAYSYDPLDRVTQVTKDGIVTEQYAHDGDGNVTSQTVGGTFTNYTYDRNRLVAAAIGAGTNYYNYDPLGRLDTITSEATGQVLERDTYDGFSQEIQNQQINSSGSGYDTTSYTYDPMGRQVSETTADGTTDFQYLGLSSELVNEINAATGAAAKSYTYTPGGLRLSQTIHNSDGTNSLGYYTYNDHDDVEAVTGSTGNTTARGIVNTCG